MELKELQSLVAEFRDKRDWKQFHNPKDLALAISFEASELSEHFLWKNEKEVRQVIADKKKKDKIEEELADILSFLLSFADVEGIDLEKALKKKIEKNKKKYPADKVKGNAKKYSEYRNE